MDRRHFLATAGGVSIMGLAGCTSGRQTSDFPNESIEFIIPFGQGGGFDTLTRLMATHMTDHVPVDITTRNVEGGAGVIGLTEVYNAEPDGYTNGVLWVDGFAQRQVTQDVEYNLREMTHYPQIATTIETLNVGAETDITSWDEYVQAVQNEEVVFGVIGGVTAGGTLIPVLLGQLTDSYPMEKVAENIVTYQGRGEMINAVNRGDIHVVVGSQTSTAQYVEAGDLRRIATFAKGDDKQTDITPGVNNFVELGVLTEDEMERVQGFGGATRAYGGPPGIPSERRDYVRQAITDTLQSDSFLEAANEANLNIRYADSETVSNKVDSFLELWERNSGLVEDIREAAE